MLQHWLDLPTKHFHLELSSTSVCAGLFDTAASQTEVCSELTRAMAMSQKGIHAILLVLTTKARFTAEEVACLSYLRSAYGGQLLRHCILVFTHGDNLEEEETPLEEFLRNCPESLQVDGICIYLAPVSIWTGNKGLCCNCCFSSELDNICFTCGQLLSWK